jgi:VWFA-related protein
MQHGDGRQRPAVGVERLGGFFLRAKTKSIQVVAGFLFLSALPGVRPSHAQAPGPAALGNTAQVATSAQTVAQESAPPPTLTLHTTVRRVAVDVVVTDSKGHPVKGLTRDDFQVLEDGVPQTLRSFDPHALSPGPAASSLADTIHLPPNTFANLVRAPEDSPVVVILYDVLNTPASDLPYAHAALVKFIKAQKQGSRIAIFVLSSRLRMLQGFTDDETRLLTSLNSKAARTQQSSLLLTTDSSATDDNTDPNAATSPADIGAALAGLTDLEAMETVFMQQERLEATEDAFAEIARFVSGLPGRKNLIWLSGSFPGNALPNSDPAAQGTSNEFGNTFQMEDKIKETNDLLNQYHVSVYPVDIRGLQVNPMFSAGSNKGPGNRPSIVGNPSEAAEHGTMDTIAESTGGRAFYNTNGLQQAMQTAIDEGSVYYALTYAPTNTKTDGTLRKIKVQLRRPGYELAYRRSYFADDLTHGADTPTPAATTTTAAAHNMLVDAAMQHGAPISSELFFEVQVFPAGPAEPATAKEMEQLSQFMKSNTKSKKAVTEPAAVVTVQHYRIDYAVLGRQLALPETTAGKYRTGMVFAVAAFTPDSLIDNGLEVTIKNEIPAAQYQKIRTQGYHASLTFVAPVEASALRVAARDDLGNKMGTIEIPLPVPPPPGNLPSVPAPPTSVAAPPPAVRP